MTIFKKNNFIGSVCKPKANFFWVSMAIIISLFSVFAIQITNFNGYSNNINISYTGNANATLNITLHRNANVTNASMNLSGFLGSNATYTIQEDYDSYYNTTNWSDGTGNAVIDGNWTSYATSVDNNQPDAYIYVNYTKPTTAMNTSQWIIKGGSPATSNISLDIPSSCWEYNETLQFRLHSHSQTGYHYARFSCLNSSDWGTVYTFGANEIVASRRIYEERMNWSYGTYPTNPYISINNTQIWNFTGSFNQTNNRTNDFSSTFNTALNSGACDCVGCLLSGNNCSINFTIHSDTAGILGVNDLNITWLEYNIPNLTITAPNGTYDEVTYIPITFSVSDDWALDTCYYNVTRGASSEVDNTIIAGCLNTTLTVSGNANYVFRMCVNDTSGNSNCSQTNFTTTNYIPPPSSSPGGGGGGIIEKLIKVIRTPFCDKRKEAFGKAWDEFFSDYSWVSFKALWFAFWDSGLCESSASIIPLELET